MKVAIVNYEMGNIGSVRRALENMGVEGYVAEYPDDLHGANRIILPGVGSFAQGMTALQAGGWVDELYTQVQVKKKPLLGICLGMQLLANKGYEGAEVSGLGYLKGEIRHLRDLGCKGPVPHVGWNDINRSGSHPMLTAIPDHTDVYFVHSYAYDAPSSPEVLAHTKYGDTQIVAAVGSGHIMGTQFHPEKSSRAGAQILKNFIDFVVC
jgi:glutamine amidotransferase